MCFDLVFCVSLERVGGIIGFRRGWLVLGGGVFLVSES